MQWLNNGDLVVASPQYSVSVFFVPSDDGKFFHYPSANTITGNHEAAEASDQTFTGNSIGCLTGFTLRWDK